MKAVLISIRPKWCELIASGKKTIEVRKTRPNIETPFKCYIYCTNRGRPLVWGDRFDGGSFVPDFTQTYGYSREEAEKIWDVFNGKVIGEFICDEIEYAYDVFQKGRSWQPLLEKACLSGKEANDYGRGKFLYFWHISNLEIYDEPKDLRELEKPCMSRKCPVYEECGGVEGGCIFAHHIRPPQSWCYVEKST